MKKLLKKNNLILILALFSTLVFFTGVESCAEKNPAPVTSNTVAPISAKPQTAEPKKIIPSDNIPEKNAYAHAHMKKKGFKYSLFKFFMAMLGVLISALAIYGGLKVYKKIMLKNSSMLDNIDYKKTLESPKDFKEAINLFLDKTDKRE